MQNGSQNLGWIDKTLVGSQGAKIGKIIDVHVDDYTGEPDWLAVNTGGRFGGVKKRYVPLEAAVREGDEVMVPYSKDMVKQAPVVETTGALTNTEAQELASYYQPDRPLNPDMPQRPG